ncbi:MAG: biotin--[acetyl-CoA-carboxylase] ligase [Taibaiella sp.]|nr:biotin--[acetyl-CoA-carboxylase] ligase [Taibaiella sp.]
MSLQHAPVIELDFTDSTNNYAMQLIDGNKAQHGMTIVARSQTNGKGQRGRTWVDVPGESLLMSVIVVPHQSISEQFMFNAAIALSIANVLQKLNEEWKVNIKWPNDIIVNDKKAGGILIENILRGAAWSSSVIGLGLNVNQSLFPDELPYAVSLKIASGKNYLITELVDLIRTGILKGVDERKSSEEILFEYNKLLFKKGDYQYFSDQTQRWRARILSVTNEGMLVVQLEDCSIVNYYHGLAAWEYGG